MSESQRLLLGSGAAVIAAGASAWYVYTILVGRTRPHRVTWAVWSLIGILGVASTIEAGAGPGAYVAIVYAGLTIVIFALSLNPRFGKPNAERRSDWLLGGLSVAALVGWLFADLPNSAAVTVAVLVDCAIAWPTVREAWRQPQHEAISPWLAGLAASCLALVALERFAYASVLYPSYLALLQASVSTVLLWRRGE